MSAKCIVLDVDDTLYLERDYVRSGFEAIGELISNRWRITDFTEQAWALFEAGIRGDVYQRFFASRDIALSSDDLTLLVNAYRAHLPSIELLDDARRFLADVRDARLAVLTDGPSASQHAKVTALGLRKWIQHIVITGDHGAAWGKPSAVGFQSIEKSAGHKGAECVYVADNPLKDFVGPRALGWRTIRIRRPQGLHTSLPSGSDVDNEVVSFDELQQVLCCPVHRS